MIENGFPYSDKYHNYLEVELNLAESTVKSYMREISVFASWAEENFFAQGFASEQLETCHIRRYLAHLKNQQGNGSATRNRKLAALKSYYAFLYLHEYITGESPVHCVKRAKEPKPLPVYLTLEEAKALLKASRIKSRMPERDYAMVNFLLLTGCRSGELIDLRVEDVDFKDRAVRFMGKGSKERLVPLTGRTIQALENYLAVRKPATGHIRNLFLSNKGTPVAGNTLRRIIQRSCREAAITKPYLSTIKMRHTCLTLLLKENVDLVILKEIAGHKTIRTTVRYTHVAQNELREAIKKHPLG